MLYIIRNKVEEDEILYWNNADGWVTMSEAWAFSPEEMLTLDLPTDGEWEPQPKARFTFDDLRHRLLDRPTWFHVFEVIAIIEATAKLDRQYAATVERWMTDRDCSTIWLRDEIMLPLKNHPRLVEIGKKFNPTTEWDNTWMPLDSLMACIVWGRRLR